MSSSQQFPSGLNHWVDSDKPIREDFVQDNQLLDENVLWKQDYDADGAVKAAGGIPAYMDNIFMPTGALIPYAGTVAPVGWLKCDGQAISRTDYSKLFAVIGVTYGSGNGETTFNIPNMQDRFPLGTNAVPGTVGGARTHTITLQETPVHNHGGATGSAGSHYHVTDHTYLPNGKMSAWTYVSLLSGGSKENTNTVPHHTHTVANAGGGQPHNNMPPYITVSYIIKT